MIPGGFKEEEIFIFGLQSKRIQSKAEATKGILKGREYFENLGGESND